MNFYDTDYVDSDQGHWSLYGSTKQDSKMFISDPDGNLTDPEGYDPDEDPEDIIDDIIGPHPEDPKSDDWGPHVSRFRFKLMILLTGLVMTLVTPIMGMIYRPSIKYWIIILYVMFCGIGVLWTLPNM